MLVSLLFIVIKLFRMLAEERYGFDGRSTWPCRPSRRQSSPGSRFSPGSVTNISWRTTSTSWLKRRRQQLGRVGSTMRQISRLPSYIRNQSRSLSDDFRSGQACSGHSASTPARVYDPRRVAAAHMASFSDGVKGPDSFVLNKAVPLVKWASSAMEGGRGGEEMRWRSCIKVNPRVMCMRKRCCDAPAVS